jgi:hypothetical protein
MIALPRPSAAMGPFLLPDPQEPRFGDPDGPDNGPRYIKISYWLPGLGVNVYVEFVALMESTKDFNLRAPLFGSNLFRTRR